MTTTKMYHGTSLTHANSIVGPPSTLDVTRGGGEFGRGFYFGASAAFAKTWASNRSPQSAIIEAEPLTADLIALHHKNLDHRQSDALRAKVGDRKTQYLTGLDLVIGTVQDRPQRIQYKFESAASQIFLRNNANLRVIS